VLGEHRFVGVPRSQCLISRKDLKGLHQIFWAHRLRPGQPLSQHAFARLLAEIRGAPLLTRALRDAAGDTDYREPLNVLIATHLKQWDGRRPEHSAYRSGERQPFEQSPSRIHTAPVVTLALSIPDSSDRQWEVRWRFPSGGVSTRHGVRIGGTLVPAFLERTGNCFITASTIAYEERCTALLSEAAGRVVPVNLESVDGADLHQMGEVRRLTRRLLAWDTADPSHGEMLVERGWPVHGPAYLLHLESDLKLDVVLRGDEFESIDSRGLPPGWLITCIHIANRLTPAQRSALLPGESADIPPARIRFVGGRPLLRGGAHLYASYDLPMAEVDAPAGATLLASGLWVEEVWPSASATGKSIRRFRIGISPETDGAGTFELAVLDGRERLAAVGLRLSAEDGEGVGTGREFTVDNAGRSRHNDQFLRGASHGSSEGIVVRDLVAPPLDVHDLDLSRRSDGNSAAASPIVKFLDTVAQLGSLSYGSARDQLLRFSDESRTEILPALTLLELRAKGHLELETDAKGHLLRVHAVPPTIYSVPARCNGWPVFGLCGSLRLAHWNQLQTHEAFVTSQFGAELSNLQVFHVAADGVDKVERFCRERGFRYEALPANRVASWAASLEEVRAQLSYRAWEAFAADLDHLQRLKADSAQFLPVPERRLSVDAATKCQLFRFDDPQAPSLQLYVLGLRGESGRSVYTHIHDSRWGVWLAEAAFALMLLERFGLTDACPWPIPYNPSTRDLWLPVRLRPPFIIERTLVLCSSSLPEQVRIEGRREENQLELHRAGSGLPVGMTSLVYLEFVPATWLRYQWIPEEIANKVAAHLGGTLSSLLQGQPAT